MDRAIFILGFLPPRELRVFCQTVCSPAAQLNGGSMPLIAFSVNQRTDRQAMRSDRGRGNTCATRWASLLIRCISTPPTSNHRTTYRPHKWIANPANTLFSFTNQQVGKLTAAPARTEKFAPIDGAVWRDGAAFPPGQLQVFPSTLRTSAAQRNGKFSDYPPANLCTNEQISKFTKAPARPIDGPDKIFGNAPARDLQVLKLTIHRLVS